MGGAAVAAMAVSRRKPARGEGVKGGVGADVGRGSCACVGVEKIGEEVRLWSSHGAENGGGGSWLRGEERGKRKMMAGPRGSEKARLTGGARIAVREGGGKRAGVVWAEVGRTEGMRPKTGFRILIDLRILINPINSICF